MYTSIQAESPEWLTNGGRRANIVSAAMREKYYYGAVMKR
jgi:hypothetical protein